MHKKSQETTTYLLSTYIFNYLPTSNKVLIIVNTPRATQHHRPNMEKTLNFNTLEEIFVK